MKIMRLLQIIKEEISNYYSDWQMGNEPSIADKIYTKSQGIETEKPETNKINAELIGYVKEQNNRPLPKPIPIYKNPKTLTGFSHDTRGILLNNGDLYLAQNYNALHENTLELLAEHKIVTYVSIYNYAQNYPRNFIAVVRAGSENIFGQSTAYDEFPDYYKDIFNLANQKQPFEFQGYNFNT
jgi:hypothetical protein